MQNLHVSAKKTIKDPCFLKKKKTTREIGCSGLLPYRSKSPKDQVQDFFRTGENQKSNVPAPSVQVKIQRVEHALFPYRSKSKDNVPDLFRTGQNPQKTKFRTFSVPVKIKKTTFRAPSVQVKIRRAGACTFSVPVKIQRQGSGLFPYKSKSRTRFRSFQNSRSVSHFFVLQFQSENTFPRCGWT